MSQTDKDALPEQLKLPGNRTFKAVVMRITCRDEDGVPQDLVMIPPDCPVEATDKDEYFAAYVDARLLEKHP